MYCIIGMRERPWVHVSSFCKSHSLAVLPPNMEGQNMEGADVFGWHLWLPCPELSDGKTFLVCR